MNAPGSFSYTCFSSEALHTDGMLLHLSTACNMQCRNCFAAGEPASKRSLERMGTTILTEETAAGMVDRQIVSGAPPSIIEIGGPGESLLLADTFTLLSQLHMSYPDLPLSIWTNGLLLPDRLGDLVRSGVSRVTVSIPAATSGTAVNLYDWVAYHGRKYAAREAVDLILQQQWNGLVNAVEAGFVVTVYVASIQGVNEHEVPMVRMRAEEIGADRVVVVPLDK